MNSGVLVKEKALVPWIGKSFLASNSFVSFAFSFKMCVISVLSADDTNN